MIAIEKFAVTFFVLLMATTQPAVPVQAPPQLEKTLVGESTGIKVTGVPLEKGAVQVAAQLIPNGALVTVPVPVPIFETERLYVTPVVIAASAAFTSIRGLVMPFLGSVTETPVPPIAA
jgi:hypothetical protein